MDACVRWHRYAKALACRALRRGRGDGSDLFGPVSGLPNVQRGTKGQALSARIWRRVCSILGQCWGLRRGVNLGLLNPVTPRYPPGVRPAT